MNKKKNTFEFREDKRGSSNLFLDKKKSTVAFKISKFTSALKDPSPYGRIRVTNESLLVNIVLSISLTLFRIVDCETRDSAENNKM